MQIVLGRALSAKRPVPAGNLSFPRDIVDVCVRCEGGCEESRREEESVCIVAE
jgi:hypothetical protein